MIFFFRRQKDRYKALETPEEKRQRRIAKKEAKALKHNRARGAGQLGYTNTNNPFGDSQLMDNFVWEKVSLVTAKVQGSNTNIHH